MTDENDENQVVEGAVLCDHFPEIPEDQGVAVIDCTPVKDEDHVLPS